MLVFPATAIAIEGTFDAYIQSKITVARTFILDHE